MPIGQRKITSGYKEEAEEDERVDEDVGHIRRKRGDKEDESENGPYYGQMLGIAIMCWFGQSLTDHPETDRIVVLGCVSAIRFLDTERRRQCRTVPSVEEA